MALIIRQRAPTVRETPRANSVSTCLRIVNFAVKHEHHRGANCLAFHLLDYALLLHIALVGRQSHNALYVHAELQFPFEANVVASRCNYVQTILLN